jgi:hypothetical protein
MIRIATAWSFLRCDRLVAFREGRVATERIAEVRRLRLQVDTGELYERIRECRAAGQFGAGVVPSDFADALVDHWVNRYDWSVHEARLNAYEHFATEVAGQFVHFVHLRSAEPEARAVLLTHVWPSGFLDALDAAGPLRNTHHLVVPSIGWNALPKPDELMRRLGYDQYAVRDDRGEVPAARAEVAANRRGLRPDELAEVRWFNENLNASTEQQQIEALVLSAAMLAWNAQQADRDAILTCVMLAWFAPRLQAE